MTKKRNTPEPGTTPATEQPVRLTPLAIQQKEFRLAFRGYNEKDVDVFLDSVTEEVARLLAENKRLREQLEFKGTVPLEGTGAAEAEAVVRRAEDEADAVVRRAQEEAARILAEARNRPLQAGAPGGASTGPTPISGADLDSLNAFIVREREFLQGLAAMIQRHAQGVKDDLREARRRSDARVAEPGHRDRPGGSDGGAPDPTQVWGPPPEPAQPLTSDQIRAEESNAGPNSPSQTVDASSGAGGGVSDPEAPDEPFQTMNEPPAEPDEAQEEGGEEPAGTSRVVDLTDAEETDTDDDVDNAVTAGTASRWGPSDDSENEGSRPPIGGSAEAPTGTTDNSPPGMRAWHEGGIETTPAPQRLPSMDAPPAGRRGVGRRRESDADVRSLRELFWGED
jgi:cell division initiation protein